MRIVSVPGRLVRDPVTRRVIDEVGLEVDPNDLTWARHIADGDVVLAPEVSTYPAGAPDATATQE